MKLNVGCGEFPAAGWVNLDLHTNGPNPNMLGSALALPFRDGAFETVYAGHVLEHLPSSDLHQALTEFRRVTVGPLLVVMPDPEHPLIPEEADHGAHRAHRWPGDEHHWLPTCHQLAEHILEVFSETIQIPIMVPDQSWPITARASWQYVLWCRP